MAMGEMRKPTVGETLYSLNIGNATRGKVQKLTPVKVLKVGRKYFTTGVECGPEWKKELKEYLETLTYTDKKVKVGR